MSELVQPPLVGGSHPWKNRPQGAAIRGALLALAVFVFALTQFLPAVGDREFHRDEARWIHRAVYIRDLFHPFSDVWDEQTWLTRGGTMDEQYRLRAQPPLGSYVMGIGFLVQDGKLPNIGFWNMDHDDAWNAQAGNMPSREQLLTGRRTNAVVTALTAVALFFIARRVTNDLGGVVAAVFFALHPLAIYLATFAGSDAVLGLTIALAGVAAYRLADRPTWGRALLLGVTIGLGGAAKLSPLGIAGPLAAIGGILLMRHLRRREGATLPGLALGLLSTPVVAGITFVVSYPYLWRDPIGNTLNLLDYRTLGMELQGSLWSGIAVETRTEAFSRIGDRLGAEWTVLGRLTAANGQWPSLELALAVAGILILVWLTARRGITGATGLVATVLLSEAAITIWGLKADWARYHLPILLLEAVGIGILVGATTGHITRRVSRRDAVTTAP